ncbi:conserved hypothetical protein [Burkholderia cenocepacia HI2424]|uniref:Uncharacterized protein n=2 Tax=Burkholderia cepacia complex TaxID=87882 RepID=A0A427NYQ8_9BURK|nr:conserved hypothetical protein [Burkholderia cenocepacia HI2424]PNO76652.1 hypothetical protein DK10_007100 [Burkholderia cenocepacia]RSC12512.1 hypothetical protein EGT41_03565 [Burkholderia cenocepacia]
MLRSSRGAARRVEAPGRNVGLRLAEQRTQRRRIRLQRGEHRAKHLNPHRRDGIVGPATTGLIRSGSSESPALQGTTRSRYIEIQNIVCDLIEYA